MCHCYGFRSFSKGAALDAYLYWGSASGLLLNCVIGKARQMIDKH